MCPGPIIPNTVDVACVIHGHGYDWIYVQHLYEMVRRNSSKTIRFHVYTEEHRPVPEPMIKHCLVEWNGVAGPRRSWWYKMQLFDPKNHQGPLLYLDLDLVITKNIDWIWELDPRYFWAIEDFRKIFRTTRQDLNSSIMYWDTTQHPTIWQEFSKRNLNEILRKYNGDQDFLNDTINTNHLRFFDPTTIKSYRWQIKDGGLDPEKRVYRRPDTGAHLDGDTAVVVFHGRPKPHEITDPILRRFWENQ